MHRDSSTVLTLFFAVTIDNVKNDYRRSDFTVIAHEWYSRRVPTRLATTPRASWAAGCGRRGRPVRAGPSSTLGPSRWAHPDETKITFLANRVQSRSKHVKKNLFPHLQRIVDGLLVQDSLLEDGYLSTDLKRTWNKKWMVSYWHQNKQL